MFARLLQRFRRPAAGPAWLDPDELRQRMRRGEMHLVVDVRGPDEFDGPLGHIAGALNIPLPALAGRRSVLAGAGCPIVLVCLTDKRSSQAAAELAAAGIGDVAVLRGGMRAWGGE
ncbi:MAG TPA: rhodanese-like domain-containing protein [Stellaceae bacterium]|nr:rhodanese-like domain-containing protein [Stellaceae bacterium]